MQAGSADGIEVIAVMGEGYIEYTPVEIVRCRDCIAYSLIPDPDGERPDLHLCELLDARTRPDGYCHRARKVEHGQDR